MFVRKSYQNNHGWRIRANHVIILLEKHQELLLGHYRCDYFIISTRHYWQEASPVGGSHFHIR